MQASWEEQLLSDRSIWGSLKLVLHYFFGQGAKIKELIKTGSDLDAVVIIQYKDVDIGLKYESRYMVSNLNSSFGNSIANDKYATHQLFNLYNLPSPETILYTAKTPSLQFLNEYKRLVIKPNSGRKSRGVTYTEKISETRRALSKAHTHDKQAIVQQYVPGESYRLLFVNYQLVAALHRSKPFIIGNGTSTVAELIENENIVRSQPLTLSHDTFPVSFYKKKIPVTKVVQHNGKEFLRKIPLLGEKVYLFDKASISLGSYSRDVTTQISREITRPCTRLLKAAGLGLCGVDIISEDISALDKTYFIELNSEPGLLHHVAPDIGAGRPVEKLVAEAMYKKQKALHLKHKSVKI